VSGSEPIATDWRAAIAAAISDRLAAVGYVARGSTSARFAAALEELRAELASIVKSTGAKPMQ
jgi:hypothetical protein